MQERDVDPQPLGDLADAAEEDGVAHAFLLALLAEREADDLACERSTRSRAEDVLSPHDRRSLLRSEPSERENGGPSAAVPVFATSPDLNFRSHY